MKIGSLFDGSGGFPLAGSLCGITPVWAAEVEPYPIAVTRSRFPDMRHLGDISKVNGAEIEPVDIITFGSPCQDLSVAGKRAGLKHADNGDEETTRSGLFMEAVRIIKEMRAATNGVYPRFALWENVPGAFSSNKGEDFRTVLQELIQIVEPGAVMPAIPKNGWAYADHYCGDGWSLAYRTFDAQYWGVPQRRRRIHLIVDFTGQCARNVLFEREGVRGYFETGRTPWQAAAAHAERGTGAANSQGEVSQPVPFAFDTYNMAVTGGKTVTLRAGSEYNYAPVFVPIGDCLSCGFNYLQGAKAKGIGFAIEQAGTLRAGQFGDAVVQMHIDSNILDDQGGQQISVRTDGKSPTLRAEMHGNIPAVLAPAAGAISPCLMARAGTGGNQLPLVALMQPSGGKDNDRIYVFDKEVYNSGKNATGGHYIAEGGPAPSLRTEHPPGVAIRYIVRRLTETECARLQGFADHWGEIDGKDELRPDEYTFWLEVRNTHAAINGKVVKGYTPAQMLTWYNKLHTQSAEYKMWGNGIALPPALYCMQGIVDALGGVTE